MNGKQVRSPLHKKEVEIPDDDGPNWQGILISLLVIAGVCALIALAILFLIPRDDSSELYGYRLTLEQLSSGEFEPRRFNGSWVSDSELLFRNHEGHLVLYSTYTKASQVIVANSTLEYIGVKHYSLSSDHRFVLLAHDVEKVFEHSYVAKFKVYNISNRRILPLEHIPGERLQLVHWGPKNNQLVYVYQNNIYFKHSVDAIPLAVTNNGVEGVVFIGVPDHLYDTEILHSSRALWWSPDSNFLCFASTNTTKVGTYSYVWYGASRGLYPEIRHIKYPKAGGDNPAVSLWVADLRNPEKITLRDVKPPREVQNQRVHVWDHYYTTVTWIDSQCLSVTWLTRLQNYSVMTICCGSLWYCEVVHEEKTGKKGWVDNNFPPVFGVNKTKWFIELPILEGSFGHFKHLASVSNVTKRLEFLTQGKFDIIKVLAYYLPSNKIYFLSTREDRPGERHLFYIYDQRLFRAPVCVSCALDDRCLYTDIMFSPNNELYILECLGPAIPTVQLWSSANDSLVSVLDYNHDLAYHTENKALPKIRTFKVPIPGGYKAEVRLFLPPGQEDDEAILYPLVVQANSGPGTQLVNEKFQINWANYLSGTKNYIYALIDGRGSGNKGDKFLHEVHHRLGTIEVEDIIHVARYLRDNLPFISPAHIAVWGKDYGGYISAMTLASPHQTVFKCGIAVSPITSWIYYNSAFTERYMGTPHDNSLGYDKGDLLKKAPLLRGSQLLLIHGTADENVHFQHSAMLIKELTDAGVVFKTQLYPDSNHDLDDVQIHLHLTMEDFLAECFYEEKKEYFEAVKVKKDIKTPT